MAESVFWRDEEVVWQQIFHVMAGSEALDVTGYDISNTAGRKTRRRRTQTNIKRYVFHANAIIIQLLQL